MGIQANQFVIGTAGNDTFNFLLDTDIAGALRFRRKSDGSGGAVLTVNANGTLILPAKSMIRVIGANGYGSTNTRYRRWSTVTDNVGTDIIYADSVTLGATFTVAVAGTYAMSYTDQFSAQENMSITRNDSAPLGQPVAPDVLAANVTALANYAANASVTMELAAGAIIRTRSGSGTSTGTATWANTFVMVRVS